MASDRSEHRYRVNSKNESYLFWKTKSTENNYNQALQGLFSRDTLENYFINLYVYGCLEATFTILVFRKMCNRRQNYIEFVPIFFKKYELL